ncbi:MAG: 50S ribosomal protein L4 [Deltaproteobacteria bacterium]|nr:50S ribosomal protein L4 [Deltaproteobacteria bacterium]MBI2342667.1 50S ribosomal protein L4 [Deltaproteobacteria bacterium]MBI2973974.1 50S ribosomal protein L4 [Deltaproteobacteria bacterium]
MTVATVYDMKKKKVGDIELPDDIFSAPVDTGLLHRAVVAQLSNARQGNAFTKTRALVRGGGKKPYKQKGTGQARHGSIRSPIFVGGGAAFGPKNRDWHIELPKKMKKAVLRMALSLKNKDGNLFVVDKFASKDGKTKGMAKVFEAWKTKSGMVVTHESDNLTVRALRNIPGKKIVLDRNLSVYDCVKYEHLLVTKDAVGNLTNRLAKKAAE